jgi:hypothetical protein
MTTQMRTRSVVRGGAVSPSNSAARGEERRCEVRRAYPVTQLVAFHDNAEMPTQDMFRTLLCHDISTRGISFYHSGPCLFDHCTIALGRRPCLIYVKAEIVHYGPYLGPNQQWVIGCRFLGKVQPPV